jgi:hypothetical protein
LNAKRQRGAQGRRRDHALSSFSAFDDSMRIVLAFTAGERSACHSVQQVLGQLEQQPQTQELQRLLESELHVLA